MSRNGVSNSKLRTQRLTRATTSVKVATSAFQSSATIVGDISAGEVVTVQLNGASPSVASVSVGSRRTGAVLLGYGTVPPTTGNYYHGIVSGKGGDVLDVEGPNGASDTLSFWVF